MHLKLFRKNFGTRFKRHPRQGLDCSYPRRASSYPMKLKIPFILIYSRIVIAIVIGVIAFWNISNTPIWIVFLMSLGLLTDVFDGIIARKLNVSSEKLRIWDSNVDLFFWLTVLGSIFYLNPHFLSENFVWIFSVVALELLCYLVAYFKFKKTIATHSYLAKMWTLTLLVFLIDLTLHGSSRIPFVLCIGLGVVSRLEIIWIILKLNQWTTDVPSILNVSAINQKKSI